MNFCDHTHPLVEQLAAKLRADSYDGGDAALLLLLSIGFEMRLSMSF
jgi:hypothetical protein